MTSFKTYVASYYKGCVRSDERGSEVTQNTSSLRAFGVYILNHHIRVEIYEKKQLAAVIKKTILN